MRNKIFRTFSFITYLAVAAFSTNASAAPVVIDFGTGLAGSGGTVVYDGTDVIGTGINIGSLEAVGTSLDSVYVTNALLNFNTSLNTITVDGTIAGLNINTSITLLTGSFNNWSYSSNGFSAVFSGDGIDVKHDDLLTVLGVDLNTQFEFFSFSLGYDFDLDGNATAISTDIINASVVPVPAAVWLFGSGLIGLVGVARRRA